MILRGARSTPVAAGSVAAMLSLRRVVVGLVIVLVAVCVGALGVDPVSAHGDVGVIEIDTPEARGDLTLGLLVRVSFENDGDPVADTELGTLSVEGTGPDGQSVGPEAGFVATEVPGVYSLDLAFPAPGSWELTVTSTGPDASGTTTVQVADGAAPDPASDATTDTDDADEPTSDTLSEPVPTEGEGSATIVERGSGGDGPTPLLLTLLVAGVLLVGGVVGAVALRRRGRTS
jgi:hypothetical protein